MVQITTVTGNESFRSGTSLFRIYAANSRLFPHVAPDPWPRTFLGKASQGVAQVGRASKLHASTTPLDSLGTFWECSYEVEEGMILVAEAEKAVVMTGGSRGSNSIKRRCLIGLRVRAQGPLIKIGLQRIDDASSARFDVFIQGRMDVLSYNSMLRLGADPSRGRMAEIPLYTPSRRSALTSFQMISEAIAAPPQRRVERVTDTTTGETVVVPSSSRRRNVDLG